MKIISHRGNLTGKNLKAENTILAIQKAITQGFDVEIDVWFEENEFWLGHDYPERIVSIDFLKNEKFWIHVKNIEALSAIQEQLPESNYFWHQNDDFTLTSKNNIWTYPTKKLTKNSVIVCLDFNQIDEAIKNDIIGICTDDPVYALSKLKMKSLEKLYEDYVYECACVESVASTFFEFVQSHTDKYHNVYLYKNAIHD